jgi:hypothetical protein
MTASLKFSSSATSIRRPRRRLFVSVLFQLTMNPLMPACFAHSMCCRITSRSSLEYRPIKGQSTLARCHDVGLNQV